MNLLNLTMCELWPLAWVELSRTIGPIAAHYTSCTNVTTREEIVAPKIPQALAYRISQSLP